MNERKNENYSERLEDQNDLQNLVDILKQSLQTIREQQLAATIGNLKSILDIQTGLLGIKKDPLIDEDSSYSHYFISPDPDEENISAKIFFQTG